MPDQVRHDEDGAAAVPALPVIPRGGGSRARTRPVIPAEAGAMNPAVGGFMPRCSWMPDQVRHDEDGAAAVPALPVIPRGGGSRARTRPVIPAEAGAMNTAV